MRKIMVVAVREFIAAVKSKAFVVSIIVMPLLMFGGIFVQRQTAKMGDVKPKRVAIVDRSGGQLFPDLARAATNRNENQLKDDSGRQTRPRIELENVEPAGDVESDAAKEQRLNLSERIRKNDLFAYVEIGPNVLAPKLRATTQAMQVAKGAELSILERLMLPDQVIGESNGATYATNRPTNSDVRGFLQNALTAAVYAKRADKGGISQLQLSPLLTPPKLINHGLTRRSVDGKIAASSRENEIVAMFIPIGLLVLMFMVVLVGASPLTVNLVEEKQLRIAEVLLGSLRPFELMMGKLLGGVGVALTLAIVYFAGVYYLARQWNVAELVSPSVMMWFALFTVLATLMYGAMFIAAGSAVTNVKEAQSMLMPVMLLIMLPMFILESLLRDPSGMLATTASFFPTSAPMITVARIGIPPGIPVWQIGLAALVTLLTTAAVIWCAGRIFRVGILMQGQGARPLEMLKWIVRG
jgi:ABC-2 type transport system permease protein